jgi:type I restriction enzyme, S subunit
MAISTNRGDRTHFLVKRSQLTTSKIFVEFYLPEYQERLDALSNAPYPLKPLKKVASRLFDGPFGSNRKVDMYQDSGIPFVRVKDVLPTGIDLSDVKYVSEEKHQELNRSRVVPGNVLITIAGRVGTAAVFPDFLEEGNITGHIAGIDLPEDVNPYYVAAFLNSQFGEFQVIRLSHRTTRPELNHSGLKVQRLGRD